MKARKAILCSLCVLSAMLNCFAEGKLLKRVKQQADVVAQAYGETWKTFYGEGHYKKLMVAMLDTRPDGTPNIVLDEGAGKMTITIRLAVNEKTYNAWKDATHKRFEDAHMSFSFSDFEDPEGRMIGGKNYKFGENEEKSIRRWEKDNGGKDAYERARFRLTVRIDLISEDGRVIQQEYVPINDFSRLGFASFPIPLHNLNRLLDLPRNRFHWFDSHKTPSTDSHVEDGFTKIVFAGLSKKDMDNLEDVKCEILDEADMRPLREKWAKEAADREAAKREAERKERDAREEADRKVRWAKEAKELEQFAKELESNKWIYEN